MFIIPLNLAPCVRVYAFLLFEYNLSFWWGICLDIFLSLRFHAKLIFFKKFASFCSINFDIFPITLLPDHYRHTVTPTSPHRLQNVAIPSVFHRNDRTNVHDPIRQRDHFNPLVEWTKHSIISNFNWNVLYIFVFYFIWPTIIDTRILEQPTCVELWVHWKMLLGARKRANDRLCSLSSHTKKTQFFVAFLFGV